MSIFSFIFFREKICFCVYSFRMSEKGKNSLLTTAEVAARLGVTRWRINALIKSKRLPAERFGAIFLVRESDLRLVENRKPGRPRKSKKLQ